MINSLGGKKWNDQVHTKLAAEYLGFQPDTDLTTTGVQPGEGTTEFKRDEPTVAPVFEPKVPDDIDPTTTAGVVTPWRSQFVAPITEQQEGSWDVGQARNDAQKWRNLHMNANMNKYGLSRGEGGHIKRGSNTAGITDTQWSAFLTKRNEIDARFKKMILPAGS
jgi:hypothetical protein